VSSRRTASPPQPTGSANPAFGGSGTRSEPTETPGRPDMGRKRHRHPFPMPPARATIAGHMLTAGVLAMILFLTLYPSGQQLPADGFGCLLCDPRVSADVAANLILFLPLGFALAMSGWSGRTSLLAAAALTIGIETTQYFLLPSRDANFLDGLSNTLGAGAGFLLYHVGARVRSLEADQTDRISLAAIAGLLLALVGTAILLEPSPPDARYQIRWEESPGGLQPYGGRIVRATLGEMELPRQRIIAPGPSRTALLRGEWLVLEGIAGPPPSDLSHLFSLHDVTNREVFLVAVDGDDLVLRYRTRAGTLRLDQPSHRLPGALTGLAAGEPIRILTRWDGSGLCARVNEGETECRFGASAARGWSFLLYSESFPPGFQRLLDFLWLLALAVPAGFLLRSISSAVKGAVLLAVGLVMVGWVAGPVGVVGWTGAGAGLALGAAIRLSLEAIAPVASRRVMTESETPEKVEGV
jgi:hypothetical protein